MKIRLIITAAIVAVLVGLGANAASGLAEEGTGTAESATNPTPEDFIHLKQVTPQAPMTAARGQVIPLDVSFKAGPFPGITFVYTDEIGQHHTARLDFTHGTTDGHQGYSLKIPENFPTGELALQSIFMNGFITSGSLAGEGQFAVHQRNGEYLGFTNGSAGPLVGPVAHTYEIDFTELDLRVQP